MQYLQILVLVACAAFAGALPHHLAKRQSFHGFPFEDEDGDSKSGLFPPGFPFHHNRDRDFFNPFFSVSEDDGDRKDPFSGFGSLFELFEAQLRRMQEEIDDLNKRIDSSGPGSTSNTTVIDGHVVTVNETTHKSNDTDNPFFYHVKVINIRPSESPEQDEVFPVDDTSYTPEGEQTPEPYNPFRGDEVSHNDEENEIPQVSSDDLEPL